MASGGPLFRRLRCEFEWAATGRDRLCSGVVGRLAMINMALPRVRPGTWPPLRLIAVVLGAVVIAGVVLITPLALYLDAVGDGGPPDSTDGAMAVTVSERGERRLPVEDLLD